jgi:hypothetical protein
MFSISLTRNLLAATLATGGVVLLGLAALDWTRYSAFVISLIWI